MAEEERPAERQRPGKKPYQKPEVVTEEIFETLALACGKCFSGPRAQQGCRVLIRRS